MRAPLAKSRPAIETASSAERLLKIRSASTRCRRSRPRRAFTLTEVLLVLVVLATAAAAVVPDAIAWRIRAQVREAAQAVQTALQATRVRAIESGDDWVFLFVPESSDYRLEPMGGRRDFLSLDGPRGSRPSSLEVVRDALPHGCRFLGVATGVQDGAAQRVRFRADGTSEAKSIRLISPSGERIVVEVERLTGACRVASSE